MSFTYAVLLLAIGLFLGMLCLLETGRLLGRRHKASDDEKEEKGIGAVEGAVFGLLGLLLAFTFAGASERFDTRRHLIVEEANAIGTAYLRLDLLNQDARDPLREKFRNYLDSRLAVYRKIPDMKAVQEELDRSVALQHDLWSGAVAACHNADLPAPAAQLLLPALNEMIDITTTRTMATKMHPPFIVFTMLAVLALASALLIGYSMAAGGTRSWIHMLAFAFFMTLTIYVIVDMEYPRLGFIRVDAFDKVLVDLRQDMK
jgi:hypothetical protein